MRGLLFTKRVRVQEIICENLPRYGVVVVVVNVETDDSAESDSGREISDMFLRKFILYQTNVQIIWR